MSLLILVVDDEPDVEALFRQQFRRDIRDGRFTMDFAQSGDGALKLIGDAAGASLILILSDINMPGMTGLELLTKAKAARPDVPVIMITGYGNESTRRKALEGGAEAILTNPIDFTALRSEIDSRVAGPVLMSTKAGRSALELAIPRDATCLSAAFDAKRVCFLATATPIGARRINAFVSLGLLATWLA